jgi:hypothetical protein
MRAVVFFVAAFTMGWMIALGAGCGAKTPSEPVNPLGGPINTGGKPDVDKSHGTIGTGGEPNTGGAPDVNKSHGTIGTGGPVNSGGAPDVKKSLPKSSSK